MLHDLLRTIHLKSDRVLHYTMTVVLFVVKNSTLKFNQIIFAYSFAAKQAVGNPEPKSALVVVAGQKQTSGYMV